MSRHVGGRFGRRLAAAGLALVCAALLVVSGPLPALGIPVDPGGGDGGGDSPPNPCASITGSLTLSSSTVYLGQPVVATWSTNRPGGCGTVSMLSGPGTSGAVNGMGGTQTVVPPAAGTATYTVTAFYPGGKTVAATASVTVLTCPTDQGVTWPVDAVHPVFYGTQDLTMAANGVPTDMTIYYPSVDGTPSSARMLRLCNTKWPVVLFLHGQPPAGVSASGYQRRFSVTMGELARSGYVVVAPNYDAELATPDASPAMVAAAMQDVSWVRHNWSEAGSVDQRPEQTAVMGHSYGALLAARVAPPIPRCGPS